MSIKLLGGSFTKTTFPAGESCIRVQESHPSVATIDLKFESNIDLFDLALLVDALRNMHSGIELKLQMAYVPYARQDRVCNPGESLSIKIAANFINSLNFSTVSIVDPHSDVTPALLSNVKIRPQEYYARSSKFFGRGENTIIVAPDAGASKKASKFAKEGGFLSVVQAEKVRDVMTGRILETRVPAADFGDKDFLIVDDIADGCASFLPLAEKLKQMTSGKVMLYVTHGIFSKGLDILVPYFDKVYCANIMLKDWEAHNGSGVLEAL